MIDTYINNNFTCLKSGRLELFTPQNYIEREITLVKGIEVLVLGLINYRYYKKEDSTTPSEKGILKIPSILSSFPSDIIYNIQPNLYPESDENYKYTKLVYEPGSRIYNRFLIRDLENVMVFTNLILNGKLDSNIPYNYISPCWVENILMNNINISVPIVVLDSILSEIYRDRKDLGKTFAQALYENPKLSMISYAQIPAKNIAAKSSVFAAITGEDFNSMMDSAMVMTKLGKEQKISPAEAILKM